MSGKALVTGAGRGIGRAIALMLAEEGFDVAIHYRSSARDAQAVVRAAEEFGVNAVAVRADLTDAKRAAAMVAEAAKKLGGLSVVVNNVGNYIQKPLEKLSEQEWREMLNTNLHSTVSVTQAALPYLRKAAKVGTSARVVNLGYAGLNGLEARSAETAYAIAKTGVVLYSKSLARELAREGITVNVVSPGVAENSVLKPVKEIPMRKTAKVSELAAAVKFFVSEDSSYVTGQNLEVAGGWRL